MPSDSPSSQWGLWNVGSMGSPSVSVTTLAESWGPSGTPSAGRFGIWRRRSRRSPSRSRSCVSRASSFSPRKEEGAARSERRCSACFASLVSAVFMRRASSPTSLDRAFRSPRRVSPSWRVRRRWPSGRRSSSRGVSVEPRRARPRRTSSGCSRISWMESMLAAPLSLRCDPLSRRLDRLQGEQADVLRQGDGDAAGGELQGLVGAQRVFVQPVEVAQGRVVAAAVSGATEVYEVDVLVAFARLVALLDEDRVRGLPLARVGERQDGRGGDDLRGDARLLLHLAEDGLQRVFVRLDMAAGRHPLLEALVPVEERPVALHDEAGGGEVAPHQAGSSGSCCVFTIAPWGRPAPA